MRIDDDDVVPRIDEAPAAAREGGEGGSMWNGGVRIDGGSGGRRGTGRCGTASASEGSSGDGVREKDDVRRGARGADRKRWGGGVGADARGSGGKRWNKYLF